MNLSGFDIQDCMMEPITEFFEDSDNHLNFEQLENLKKSETGRTTIEVKLKQKTQPIGGGWSYH